MGQATIDLPDPLEALPAADTGNADELLSEMAGAEIDRLLAASDIAAGDGNAKTPQTTTGGHPSENDPELDALFRQIESESETIAATERRTADQEIQSRGSADAAPLGGPFPGVNPLASAAEAIQAPLSDQPGTGAAEQAALLTTMAALDETHPGDSSKVSLLVRLLELINGPLAHSSEWLRELLGKLALLTLLNAAGLLVFVLLFRKH